MTKKPEVKLDPEDGLPALGIGEWAQDKHRILAHYIEASTPARRKAYPESAFIDLEMFFDILRKKAPNLKHSPQE